MISNRKVRHFYSARHFGSIISLYLGFYIVFLQITFIIAILISFSAVFVFDSIVIVNRFFNFCIYCNVCNAHLIILIENGQYKY